MRDARANRRLGVLLVAGAAFWWGTGGLFVRAIELDAWTVVFWRSFFAALSMGAILIFTRGAGVLGYVRQIGWPGVLMGLCFCIASTAYIPAVHLTSVANTLILQSLSPFLAALLGFILMREPVGWRTWAAMAVSLVGIYIMVANSLGGSSGLGIFLGFLIAIAYATAVVVTRQRRNVQMLPATCLAAIFAAVFSFAMLAAGGHRPWPIGSYDLALLAAFGALQMAGGMVMFTYGIRLIPAAEGALLSVIETVTAPLWVYVVFGENPGLRALIGGAIVLAAVIGRTWSDLQASRVTA